MTSAGASSRLLGAAALAGIVRNGPMSDTTVRPRPGTQVEGERPRLYKVILRNNDHTPREFVVAVLKAEFRMGSEQACRGIMTAHRRGACVVAVHCSEPGD